jgi:hypothetical protein
MSRLSGPRHETTLPITRLDPWHLTFGRGWQHLRGSFCSKMPLSLRQINGIGNMHLSEFCMILAIQVNCHLSHLTLVDNLNQAQTASSLGDSLHAPRRVRSHGRPRIARVNLSSNITNAIFDTQLLRLPDESHFGTHNALTLKNQWR